MPPRLRSSNLCSSTSTLTSCQSSTPSIRPSFVNSQTSKSREFSHSSRQQVTERRRNFYAWLNGPGAQVRAPLPNSTNYLGAYDRLGNLVRAGPGYRRKSKSEIEKERTASVPKEAPEEDTAAKEEPPTEKSPTESQTDPDLEDGDAALQRYVEKMKTEGASEESLPPETAEDLRPFPLNKYFRSQPVLSEGLREAIYQRVKQDGATVPLVSVEFGVSNERVGAVVRLKQVEKEWIAQGKTLATPYSRAVLEMLPTTPYIDLSDPSNKGQRPIFHESINDLIVHPATRQQLFVPVAESRIFTREDAGKAFDNNLLPADDRIPHPELIQSEREKSMGLGFEERKRRAAERFAAETEAKRVAEEKAKQERLKTMTTVPKRRWDFVFQNISVEQAGKNGRGPKGVGWRYGFPHEDRKKGQVKIPTQVEA